MTTITTFPTQQRKDADLTTEQLQRRATLAARCAGCTVKEANAIGQCVPTWLKAGTRPQDIRAAAKALAHQLINTRRKAA